MTRYKLTPRFVRLTSRRVNPGLSNWVMAQSVGIVSPNFHGCEMSVVTHLALAGVNLVAIIPILPEYRAIGIVRGIHLRETDSGIIINVQSRLK